MLQSSVCWNRGRSPLAAPGGGPDDELVLVSPGGDFHDGMGYLGARADLLEEQIFDLRAAGADRERLDVLRGKLAEVRMHHIDTPDRLAWLTGNAVNESWSELHRIEERIDELTPTGASRT